MALPPFTDAHRPIIDDALRHIYEARRLIEKLEPCGVPCDQHRQMADQLETYLTEFKSRFITPKPPMPENRSL